MRAKMANRAVVRRLLALGGIALAVVCFIAVNLWAGLALSSRRLDLTQTRQYTLAPATRTVLGNLQEPVTLRLYVSAAVRSFNPLLATYADRVRDTLRAYALASGGKITLELIDPEPFSAEEDRALGFGLQALPLDQAGATGYLGLAGVNGTDDVDVVPVLTPDREPFLEYDLTRLVYNLANPDKPAVALITGLPLNGDPTQQYRPWEVYRQVSQFFDVRVLGGDVAAIDPAVKVVLLVHPADLSAPTRYAVDQFVMRGGRVLAFVDPHAEAAAVRQRQEVPGPIRSDPEDLLASWGVELAKGVVVADPAYARQVQYPSGGRVQAVDYLPWLALERAALSRTETVTADLDRITMASAGILSARAGASTTFTPLLTASPAAQALEVDKVAAYPDPLALLRDYRPGDAAPVLAARLSGPAKTAFPDPLPEGVNAGDDRLLEAKQPIDVIVVADADFLDDRLWLAGQGQGQPIADNANLTLNALDYLAGSGALAGLRGHSVTFRPFERVEAIRRDAERRFRAKEQELVAKLTDTQRRQSALQVATPEGVTVSAAQRQEVERFRGELLETRRELRETRFALRSDIEALRDRLQLVNILAVPALVALTAVVVASLRRSRRRRRQPRPTLASGPA